ncbi:MAG: ABC transporter permease [Bacillota bacterium]
MKAFALHFSFEFAAGLRNRTLLMMNYLFPLGFYFLAGAMMTGINPLFREQLLPAMVIFAVLAGSILGLPAPLVEAREAGILRSYRINGVPAGSLLAIPALSTAIHLILAAAVITVTAPPVFKAPLPQNWPASILVFLLMLFAYSGLGSLIGVISGNSRLSILWSQLIYLPSILLSGMMVPAEMMPPAFIKIGHLLPASYAMQGFIGLGQGQPLLYEPGWALLVLLAGGFLAFALAQFLFTWDSQNSARRGHPLLAVLALLPYLLGALLLV